MAPDALSRLAEAVADDTDVDWAAVESTAEGTADLEPVRQLRLVASLGRTARALVRRWGPFELRAELGKGAFGTVYRAWDPRVGREVALKLLHARHDPETSPDESIAEARLLAGVDHPNVVPVYGADVHDGVAGIWTKLVAGKTLKDLLVEQGPFSGSEAAQIGQHLCDALAAVHRRGVVHRDLKAQNVMREVGGAIVLMDFGAGVSAGRAIERLAGSPAYLAPELLDGGPATPESDVYSLGVLLFHLVTGSFPVEGASLQDLQARHRSGRRQSLRALRSDLAPGFVEAVDRALAPAPADRPGPAALHDLLSGRTRLGQDSVATAMRGPAWAMALALALAVGLGAVVSTLWRDRASDSLAVLPIRNLTGDPANDYVASGLTEVLTATVAELPGLKVPSTIATAPFRDSDEAPSSLGRRLGVNLLLAGAVTEAGDRVRLSVQLVEASTGRAVWGEELVRARTAVLGARSEIAAAIAARLKLAMPPARHEREISAAAQDAYLRGLVLVNQQQASAVDEGARHLRQAVALAPDFAAAWGELALAELRGMESGDWTARARQADVAREQALTAIRLDPAEANGYVALASVQYNHDWDFAAADATFRRALTLAPNHSAARMRYAYFLAARRRVEEAIAHAVAARDLEPLVPVRSTSVGIFRYYARDYEGALADMQRALDLSPGFVAAHYGAGRVLTAMGRPAEAADRIRLALGTPPSPAYLAGLAYAHTLAGDLAAAEAALADMAAQEAAGRHASIDNLAYVAVARGQHDEAFRLLGEAIRRRMTNVLWLAVDPRVDPLRTDPRFSALLRELSLPPHP